MRKIRQITFWIGVNIIGIPEIMTHYIQEVESKQGNHLVVCITKTLLN